MTDNPRGLIICYSVISASVFLSFVDIFAITTEIASFKRDSLLSIESFAAQLTIEIVALVMLMLIIYVFRMNLLLMKKIMSLHEDFVEKDAKNNDVVEVCSAEC